MRDGKRRKGDAPPPESLLPSSVVGPRRRRPLAQARQPVSAPPPARCPPRRLATWQQRGCRPMRDNMGVGEWLRDLSEVGQCVTSSLA